MVVIVANKEKTSVAKVLPSEPIIIVDRGASGSSADIPYMTSKPKPKPKPQRGRPFEKGHAYHAHTKRRGISLTAMVRSELDRIPTIKEDGFDGKGKSNAYWIAYGYVTQARDGDRGMIRDILDRLEGKPVQILSGPGGGPIETKQEIKVITVDDLKPALDALLECGAVRVSRN